MCAARAPRVATIPHLLEAVTSFLVQHSARAISSVVERGWLSLARSLLEALARDTSVHYLDKRLRARKAMTAAAFLSEVELMEEIYGAFRCLIDEEMVREAVRGGSCSALRSLHAKLVAPAVARGRGEEARQHAYTPVCSDAEVRQLFFRDLLTVAAGNGDLEMLQTLLGLMRGHFERARSMPVYQGVALAFESARAAARHGHSHIIDWLRPRFELPSEQEMDDEAHTGPFNDEELTRREQCSPCRKAAGDKRCTRWRMDNASLLGRLQDVQWFHEHRSEHGCSTNAMDCAASHGHLEVVRWLHENRREGCTDATIGGAAQNGHLEVVHFLLENRTEAHANEGLCAAAAGGHLDIIKYLRASGAKRDLAEPLRIAASGGHLHVIKWLLEEANEEEKRPERVTSAEWRPPLESAACNGHLEVVKYLFANLNQGRV